jgi:hypothetical protein
MPAKDILLIVILAVTTVINAQVGVRNKKQPKLLFPTAILFSLASGFAIGFLNSTGTWKEKLISSLFIGSLMVFFTFVIKLVAIIRAMRD